MKTTIHEALNYPGPLTNRQYEAWNEWLDLQWNRPSRTDHYLMQVALNVLRSNAKNPGRFKMKDCELQFRGRERKPRSKAQRQLEMQWSKFRWATIIGTDLPPRPSDNHHPSPEQEPLGEGEYAVEERIGS